MESVLPETSFEDAPPKIHHKSQDMEEVKDQWALLQRRFEKDFLKCSNMHLSKAATITRREKLTKLEAQKAQRHRGRMA